MRAGLNRYFEELLLRPSAKAVQQKAKEKLKSNRNTLLSRSKITLSQYFEKELLKETTAAERRLPQIVESSDSLNEGTSIKHEDEEIDIYTSYASYMSSSDPGSDNLLVTFDYGFEDSLEADISLNSLQHLDVIPGGNNLKHNLCKITEEKSSEDLHFEIHSKSPNIFKVHQAKYAEGNDSIVNTAASGCLSRATSHVECNIDISGDYGSWAQSESGSEEGNSSSRPYRYEDLIKDEVLHRDDGDGNGDDGGEVLVKFNFNDDIPPLWFNNNEQLYYRSVDYLN